MAALTDAELHAIRREVGSVLPTDADLQTAYDRLGDIGAVVLEVLDQRLADLLASPATFTVFGEYAQSNEANIIALREQLKRLRAGIDDDTSLVKSGFKTLTPTYRVR